MASTAPKIEWETDSLHLTLVVNENGVVGLHSLRPRGTPEQPSISPLFKDSDLPLVSIRLVGEGNTADKTSKCLIGSYLSARLKYQSHEVSSKDDKETLDVDCYDEATGVRVVHHFLVYVGVPVLRSSSTIYNTSQTSSVVVKQLSSLTIGGLTRSSPQWVHDYQLKTATNSWFREAQWRDHNLSDIGIDDNGICSLPESTHRASHGNFSLSSHGSFSTSTYLPMGLLKRSDEKDVLLWQIENNGSWRWEIGDFKDSVYLALGGPTAVDHNWKQVLAPGGSFTTVTAALCRTSNGVDAAFGALNEYRRRIYRRHEDTNKLPVIFNDYMNCLMGDPDEQKIHTLLDPVARAGAEYFVIDAGWYADDSNWWDDVGLWEPSKKRFPSGFRPLLDTIRNKGLIPGLWLEPEVVGVRSVVADRLPEEAFFHEDGKRIIENGRYQLDYRHPEVRTWMSSVIHRLVTEYRVGYFKFDYNIEVIQGTDVGGESPGAAHLEHQRAYLSWVEELFDRHPGLVIESCSSGAQRLDYAMLSVHPLQSTSDQQDPFLYAAISAAVPTAVTPEQSASWAYPQGEWDDEKNAFTVVNALLGRFYLSGHLNKLNPRQFALVSEGVEVYKAIRQQLRFARPIWPLGLPRWHDDWVCLGMLSPSSGLYVAVWHRNGSSEIDLPFAWLKNSHSVKAKLLYPSNFEVSFKWGVEDGVLKVTVPDIVCARFFQITY